jgi:hypothetical protein
MKESTYGGSIGVAVIVKSVGCLVGLLVVDVKIGFGESVGDVDDAGGVTVS